MGEPDCNIISNSLPVKKDVFSTTMRDLQGQVDILSLKEDGLESNFIRVLNISSLAPQINAEAESPYLTCANALEGPLMIRTRNSCECVPFSEML
jgi:hypothetical protein